MERGISISVASIKVCPAIDQKADERVETEEGGQM
jgi:hypothetical protein